MSVRTRIEPLEQEVAVLLSRDLSPEAASRTLADAARQVLDEAQARNRQTLGYEPGFEAFVDGRASAPLDTVRPDGTIVFEFEILLDLFAWIEDQLITHSPVLTGRYRANHAFYAGGELIDPGGEIPPADEYVFVSLVPYARKIERGLSRQAPDGVYEVVAALAQRRFGNVARVRFGYRTPRTGMLEEWAQRTSLGRRGRRMTEAVRAEWLRRQPAVIIVPRG